MHTDVTILTGPIGGPNEDASAYNIASNYQFTEQSYAFLFEVSWLYEYVFKPEI